MRSWFTGVREEGEEDSSWKPGVWIHGLDNILTRFARCCNPVPGDDIQGGVVTVGRGGISVHRKDCINIRVIESLPSGL